ncbi:MAG: hypothetical protein ABI602_02965 [Candidatus Saccharibacteria bacterium]
MKIISNVSAKLALAVSAVSTLGLVLAPVSGYALAGNGLRAAVSATTPQTTKTSPFCTELPSKAATIETQFTNLSSKVSQDWAQQVVKQTTQYQQVDQTVATDRQKADTERTADFSKLDEKATTSTEKQAVQTYEAAVIHAVTVRRAAFDSARATFRSGVKSAISARHTPVTDQLNTFQASITGAINTAEASCMSNPASGVVVRQAFVTSLKSARQTFQADRKNDTTIGSQVTQLAATRNAAFKAASQTLQSSITAARQTLLQAFGKTTV